MKVFSKCPLLKYIITESLVSVAISAGASRLLDTTISGVSAEFVAVAATVENASVATMVALSEVLVPAVLDADILRVATREAESFVDVCP